MNSSERTIGKQGGEIRRWLIEKLCDRLFDSVLGLVLKKLLIPLVGVALAVIGCDQPSPQLPVAEPVPPAVWENVQPLPAAPPATEDLDPWDENLELTFEADKNGEFATTHGQAIKHVWTGKVTAVTDGDTTVRLELNALTPGETLAFTIDIDDTTSNHQTTVNGSEMVGATLRAAGQEAQFDATGTARINLPPCTS